jgi:type VI secretion system protein ImpG
MDPRILKYYNRELQFVREMGGEFSREFPKIAGRLGLDGFECADPYVERLLEGFAFLAARIQLELDSEFPRFTQHLLEMTYPHFLCPTPSMAVVRLQPDRAEGALADGYVVEAGTVLRSILGKGDQTACEYRTAHDTTLWPLEIVEAEYFSHFQDFANIPRIDVRKLKAGLRLRLRTTAGLTFDKTSLGALRLFLRGGDQRPMRLYEQLMAHAAAVVARPPGKAWNEVISKEAIRSVGFEDDEALLPYGARSFQGYRLLHEYFALPSRFLFVEIGDLGPAVRRCTGNELEVLVLLDRSDPVLENAIGENDFALHCTPAINLFPRRCDRIHLEPDVHEYLVVPDRTRPLDFEVYSPLQVTGHGTASEEKCEFLPFYSARESMRFHDHTAFYTVRRAPRMLSSKQRRVGPRSSYVGSEVYLSLVDAKEAPFRGDLRQLSVTALCTNRDLPLHMPVGQGEADFTLESGAPVESIRCLAGPTKPRVATTDGDVVWRFISHLSLNYLTLTDSDHRQGAAALRDLLSLYGDLGEAHIRKQIDGVRSVGAKPVVRRIPSQGPIAFGRGLELTVTCDESSFEGTGAFLLGAVLDRFFAKYVSINSFTETVVRAVDRGEIARCPVRTGQRHVI